MTTSVVKVKNDSQNSGLKLYLFSESPSPLAPTEESDMCHSTHLVEKSLVYKHMKTSVSSSHSS